MLVLRAISLLLALTLPAQADDTSKSETVWTLFSTHCSKVIEAETAAEITAALKPHEMKIFTTVDGVLSNGVAQIESLEDRGIDFAIFNVFTTRHKGGTVKSCSLTARHRDSDALSGLPAHVQTNAGDLIGADFSVAGGPIVTLEGLKGISLVLATEGFPPKQSLFVNSGEDVIVLNYTTVIPDAD